MECRSGSKLNGCAREKRKRTMWSRENASKGDVADNVITGRVEGEILEE